MIPFKPAFSLLSPGGGRARLSILIFHRVLTRPDPIFPGEVDIRQFDEILLWVKSWCQVLPLDDAVRRLKAGSLPARALSITFDDGYADNHDNALPLLRQHGLTATFFIATSFLNGGRMWNDTVIEAVRSSCAGQLQLTGIDLRAPAGSAAWHLNSPAERRQLISAILGRIKYAAPSERQALAEDIARQLGAQLPSDLMMSSSQVLALRRQGMQIGAHTHSHPILSLLNRQAALDEVGRSKTELEQLLGEEVELFAYPNGRPGKDYTTESVEVVRELGFSAAVTTAAGAAGQGSDLLQLPRFTPWDRSRGRFGLRLARNLLTRQYMTA